MVDWESLFKRYVSHVSEVEGTHFLDSIIGETEEEKAAIEGIRLAEEESWTPIRNLSPEELRGVQGERNRFMMSVFTQIYPKATEK